MIITAKFSSTCPACQKLIAVGSPVEWQKGQKARHTACVPQVAQAVVASRAATSSAEIPCPAGLSYLPFQRAGIAAAVERLQRRDGVLIADEMGLGKTIQALGVASVLAQGATVPKSVLIVCPASLRLNWAREAAKWLVGQWSVTALLDAKSAHRTTRADASVDGPVHQLTIVNYDILTKVPAVTERAWDLLICDEAQYVKNGKAQRSKAVAEIRAVKKLLLTGTPICNRPIELHHPLTILGATEFGKFFGFAKRYANAHHNGYGWDFSGAANLPELQERLRASVMIRRLKADVLTELPPKTRQVIAIPANGAAKLVAAEQEILGDLAERAAAVADSPESYADAVRALTAASVDFAACSRVRRELAVAKIPYAVEHLEQALEDGRKIVVMAHHHEVIDGLMTALAAHNPVRLDGRMGPEEREASVQRFQNDPACKVFVGSIHAAGVGITLTAASHVVFAELDWVPGNVSQAEDRCHRIGQRGNVLVQHLVFEGTVDALLAQVIVSKEGVIAAALDLVQPAPVAAPASKTIEAAAPSQRSIEASKKHAILRALQYLSARCDGAVTEDGRGFNGRDRQAPLPDRPAGRVRAQDVAHVQEHAAARGHGRRIVGMIHPGQGAPR